MAIAPTSSSRSVSIPGESAFHEPSLPFIVSGLQKGPAERGHVKKRQKSSKSVKKFFDTFDNFRAGQNTSKIVKKRQKHFRHFSTIFARHLFSGPFWGALILASGMLSSFLDRGCYSATASGVAQCSETSFL